MSDKMVTIVCCYNDIGQYRRLVDSLEKQDMEYELIGIDNIGQKYDSCSSALNSAANQIKTEYVIYAHQDIELPERDTLRRFVCFLQEIGQSDILGVAGAVDAAEAVKNGRNIPQDVTDGTYVVSNVCHGKRLEKAGEIDFSGMQTCDSVDECFFGGHTVFFREHPFDEKLCDNWHLYAVERCLHTRTKGNMVYVCDLPLLHYSSGKINHAYNRNFLQIAKKYAAQKTTDQNDSRLRGMKWMRTVCGSARTDWLHRTMFYLKREILIRMGRF